MFERAAEIDASAIALFSKNSNQWRARALGDDECEEFRALRVSSGIAPILVHASYLINLAAADPAVLERSVAAMIIELERAERIGAQAVVLHPGAHMGSGVERGLGRIARALDRVHGAIPHNTVATLLETSAGQGSSLGCTFGELDVILRSVDEPLRLGICIDTCHIFAAGYDIRSGEGWRRVAGEIGETVGIEKVGAFHLNDSKKGLGSRVDRHEHIGEGAIGLEGFAAPLNDPLFARIPKVIETPKSDPIESDRKNLGRLRSLMSRHVRL